jgi:hypothetical protein
VVWLVRGFHRCSHTLADAASGVIEADVASGFIEVG